MFCPYTFEDVVTFKYFFFFHQLKVSFGHWRWTGCLLENFAVSSAVHLAPAVSQQSWRFYPLNPLTHFCQIWSLEILLRRIWGHLGCAHDSEVGVEAEREAAVKAVGSFTWVNVPSSSTPRENWMGPRCSWHDPVEETKWVVCTSDALLQPGES